MTDEQLKTGKALQDRIKARTDRIKNLTDKMARAHGDTNAHNDLRLAINECLTPDVDYHELTILATMVRGIADRRLQVDLTQYASL